MKMKNSGWNQEYSIWKTLNAIAAQRVERVIEPSGIQVLSGVPSVNKMDIRNIQTCLMRGWIEPLENAIPSESAPDENDPDSEGPENEHTLYRLTEAGEATVYRSYVLTTLIVIALLIVFF